MSRSKTTLMPLPNMIRGVQRLRGVQHVAVICVAAFGTLFSSVDALAQRIDISGTTLITDWPDSRSGRVEGEATAPLDFERYELLPFIDSLAVHYRFSTPDPSSQNPSMHFTVEWTKGLGGILEGRPVGLDEMPAHTVIESIDLLMQVIVGDEPVAEFFLPLDTIGLGPVPSMTFVDIVDVAWDSIFVSVGEEKARQIFAKGFTLSPPRIVRVAFYAPPPASQSFTDWQREVVRPHPLERTVYIADIDLWFLWRDGRTVWVPPPGTVSRDVYDPRYGLGRTTLAGRRTRDRAYERPEPVETAAPARAATTGGAAAISRAAGTRGGGSTTAAPARGSSRSSGRSSGGRSSGGKSSNDDDDDDDNSLLIGALVGVAAVGALAVLGGTIGYSGSVSKAPIGFMSGYVQPTWGVVFQASFNRQVFGRVDGPENVILGLTGFYDALKFPVQPAFGMGVRLTEEGSDHVVAKPSILAGLAGNFGPIVILAGVDVVTPDFRLGFGVNFRHESR